MSVVGIVLLVAAAVLVVGVEWPRLAPRLHRHGPPHRPSSVRPPSRRRKAHLHVVADDDDPDDFARSVERDLAALPTIDEHDRKR